MSLHRRQILAGLAATAALAGCGGGGYGDAAPTRLIWLLNVNPEVTSADVSFGATTVASALPFPGLTPRVEIAYGYYSFSIRNRANGLTTTFDNVLVDGYSPTITVFYRKGTSTRLGASPIGIINYFDSTELLKVELDDGAGNVQLSVLAFESAAPQASQSVNCRLRLRRASDDVLVYDSGLRFREDAIVIFPADPASGLVSAAGLSYTATDAQLVSWPNTL